MPLTDTQLVLLSRAAQNDDGLISPPESMRTKSLQSAVARLLRHCFVEEVPVRFHQPSWRTSEDGKLLGMRITPAGLHALGIEPDQEPHTSAGSEQVTPLPSTPPLARVSSKRALLIDLLQQDGGTTLQTLVDATGWLPHTTRAALTGLRKTGHAIVRHKLQDGTSTYRILDQQDSSAPLSAVPADDEVH